MKQEMVQAIAQFMSRVTLQATEIEAFQECQKALQEEFMKATTEEEAQDAESNEFA